MQRLKFLTAFMLAVVLLGGWGCANPADGKTQAVVGQAEPAPGDVGGQRYVVADGSTIGFIGSKVTGSHTGGFNTFSGEIMLVNRNPTESSVKLTIDTKSLWANNDKLTNHLKSADFFDVEAHPVATFESTKIEPAEGGAFTVTGNLDLHGVTKSISFPADIEVGEDAIKAQAEFAIKRFDFNIAYKGKADDLIRDDVVINFLLTAMPEAG